MLMAVHPGAQTRSSEDNAEWDFSVSEVAHVLLLPAGFSRVSGE